MNKIYKVIWSKTRNCYVAVSELAKSHTKGCSGKRIGRVLASGLAAAAVMLPMGDAGAFSSSYVPSYSSSSGYSSQDYMTDGGHVDVSQIGGYDSKSGNWYTYVYVNNDGSIDFFKNEDYQKNDISSMIGNVAIGNFAEAGSAADTKMLNFYNGSTIVAYETKPESGSYYSTTFNGKTYWYGQNYSYRTYAYSPTYNYGGNVIEKDGKYYHGNWIPDLDENGNYQYDEHGNTIGSFKYAEIGNKIWKQNPDNPSGNLLVDYKKTDEYGNPIFDITAEDLGLDETVPYNPYNYAGGTNNVAVGNKAKTTSHSSVAVGDTSTARGWRSIAIGAESEAGADPETTYVGSWNNGTSAVAVGNSAKAYGSTSVAVGNGSQTYSFSGIAVGNGANASTEYGIAIGDNAKVAYINGAGDIEQQRTAAQSIAIGRDALAQAKDVTAVGRNAQGMMRNATAYGNNAHANGWNSIAIGNKATAGLQAEILNDDGTAKDGAIANSAIAIGNRARATAEYTTAIGAGTNAEGWHAVAIGDSNQATGRFSTAIGAGWSINHTEGEPDSDDATDGSDAINTEGKRTYESIGANQAGGDYSTAAGYGNKTVGTQSSAFGKENEVSGLSSLGVGAGNKVGAVAVGEDGILTTDQENTVSGYAVGSYNTITGSEGTNAGAFGANNTVAGDNSYAFGNNNAINEDSANTFVVGSNITTTEENTVVFGFHDGQNEHTFGKDSVSLGTNARAEVEGSVALGAFSVATRDKENGGAGAGFDVTTGENYDGKDKDTPAWKSTLAAVSVGVDNSDGKIGSVAEQTRQITGVAAGTADTDAVNVAQLRNFSTHYYSVNINPPDTESEGDSPEDPNSNYENQGATGAGALAAGYYTSATGKEATALGNKSSAKGDKSVATGYKSNARGTNSVALGVGADAYSESSSAMGIDSTAVGRGGLAIGHGSSTGVKVVINKGDADDFWTTTYQVDTDADGQPTGDIKDGGIAIGSYAHTEGTRALAVGRVAGAYGTNSTAMGLRSNAYGEGSIAFGHGVVAGDEDHPYNVQVPALHNDPTIEYDLDGTDGIVDPTNVIGAIAMGSYAKATGRGSLSVGRYSEANSAYSTAMGIRAKVDKTATNAVAIGREVSVGKGSENSVAIGKQSTVIGKDSIAIGTGHTVSGSNSGAFGDPTVIDADNSYSVGNNNEIKGDDTFVMGNNVKADNANTVVVGSHAKDNTDTFGANSVSLGTDATASVAGAVALGSGSVASRDKANGGAGAGFDVTTGTNYAGEGKDSATWKSTLAAVSVGGDSSDGSIGAAATATRQITGVAAGTADTDAVNVAQLKLAVGAVTYTAGKNVTIENNVINAEGSVYTATQTVEAGKKPGDGSTTLNLTDGDGGDAGSMKVKAGDNVTITEVKEGNKSVAVINAQNTTYRIDAKAGDRGTNVVNNYTMTGTNGDKYTFQDTDTTYTAQQSVATGDDWGKGSTTYTLKDNTGKKLKPMNLKAGKNVKITKGKNGEAVIQGNGLTGDTYEVKYDDKGVGSVTIKDEAGNTATITNIQNVGGEGVADSINYLGDRINNLDNKINKVGAGAAALAGLHPLDFDPDEKWDFSAAAGSYKGEHAVAIGAFYRPNEDTMFSIGGTIGNGNNMVNVGVSWKFGQKNRISANRISSAKEIIELRKNQEDVHSFLADAVAGNQLDLSKIQLFPDVEENHWAYDYVATMAGNGVLEGYPDGYFKGNRNMTRYEMAAVLYRLMQNGARLSDRALTEFAPELDRIRVDTITHHKDGTPHIQRVRTIKERVDEKADPSSEKNAKKKAKVKVAEKPVE